MGDVEVEGVGPGAGEVVGDVEVEGVGEVAGDLIHHHDCLIVIFDTLTFVGKTVFPSPQKNREHGSDDAKHDEVEPLPFNLWRIGRPRQPCDKWHHQFLPKIVRQAIIEDDCISRHYPRETWRAVGRA